jgi:hypothetical protein
MCNLSQRRRLLQVISYFMVSLFCSLPLFAQYAEMVKLRLPQVAPPAPPVQIPDFEFTCPGSFPSDITMVNCSYTGWQRFQQFASTGITDQAMLLSITGSLFTQAIKTPGEWPRTWKYYGYRVGASYSQSLGSASAQLIVGAIAHDDPRHVACNSDPLLYGKEITSDQQYDCTKLHRFGHALLDSVTVRQSNAGTVSPAVMVDLHLAKDMESARKDYKSRYRRMPAFARLVGAYAGAYSQYPWEPRSANTFGAISQRAALSFAPTFLGSFYTEYSSSLFSLFKRGKK